MRKRKIATVLASTAMLGLPLVAGPAWTAIASFEIGMRAELSANNTVATGTVTCTSGATVRVVVQIFQPSGLSLALGSAVTEVPCSFNPTVWEVPVPLAAGSKWKNGPADATISIASDDDAVFADTRLLLQR